MAVRQRSFSEDATPLSAPLRLQCFKRSVLPQFLGEVFWILSEVAWILLIPEVCIPTCLLSIFFIGRSAILDFKSSKKWEWWLPQALNLEWLIVNFIWMLEEMLWDCPDQQTPWDLTPTLSENEHLYGAIQNWCIVGFLMAPLAWLIAIVGLTCAATANSDGLPSPARGLFFQAGHIAMWALMDGLWASSFMWPAIVCSVVTIIMLTANAAFETGLSWIGIDRTDVVWTLWTLSNVVWILLELAYGDDLNMRYYAAGLGVLSLLLLLCSFDKFEVRVRARAESLYEPHGATISKERLLSA